VHARYHVPAGLVIAAVDVACPEGFGTNPSGVGTPVSLRLDVLAESCEGRAWMDGAWSFTGLPLGVSVQSCRGYSSAAPVSARRSDWGGR
jgi:hypothetical protein